MKLYDLNTAMVKVIENADPVTGEINQEEFESLALAKAEKQKNIVLFCSHLDGDIEAIEKEIDRLQEMKKRTAKTKDWLKNYLKASMEMDGVDELDFTTFKAKIKKNPPKLEVDSDVPEKYMRVKTITEIDKNAIKEALKSGEEVPGCRLVQGTRLDII